jgi:hypothetical protein
MLVESNPLSASHHETMDIGSVSTDPSMGVHHGVSNDLTWFSGPGTSEGQEDFGLSDLM